MSKVGLPPGTVCLQFRTNAVQYLCIGLTLKNLYFIPKAGVSSLNINFYTEKDHYVVVAY